MTDTVFSVSEVAAMLDCAEETVELLTREGNLPGLKSGRSWRYPSHALHLVLTQRALSEMTQRATPAHPASLARAGLVPVGVEFGPAAAPPAKAFGKLRVVPPVLPQVPA